MDALKVYDVKKICDARLYIVDMVAAFVRALATVLLMGRVAVLYRYRAVLVTFLCAQGRRPARSPSAPRAFGSARRLEARPGPAAAHQHCGQALPTRGLAPRRRNIVMVLKPCQHALRRTCIVPVLECVSYCFIAE